MPNPDFERLLGATIPLAQLLLKDQESFRPFGFFMSSDGEVKYVGGYGDNPDLTTVDIINVYVDALKPGASDGEYRAIALCLDVRIQIPGKMEKTDAIQIMLENSAGFAVSAFMPYQKDGGAEATYGTVFATPAIPKVFEMPDEFPEDDLIIDRTDSLEM